MTDTRRNVHSTDPVTDLDLARADAQAEHDAVDNDNAAEAAALPDRMLPLARPVDTFTPTLVLVLITNTTHATPRHLSLHTRVDEARRTFIDAADTLHREVVDYGLPEGVSFEVARDRIEGLGYTVVVEDTPVTLP